MAERRRRTRPGVGLLTLLHAAVVAHGSFLRAEGTAVLRTAAIAAVGSLWHPRAASWRHLPSLKRTSKARVASCKRPVSYMRRFRSKSIRRRPKAAAGRRPSCEAAPWRGPAVKEPPTTTTLIRKRVRRRRRLLSGPSPSKKVWAWRKLCTARTRAAVLRKEWGTWWTSTLWRAREISLVPRPRKWPTHRDRRRRRAQRAAPIDSSAASGSSPGLLRSVESIHGCAQPEFHTAPIYTQTYQRLIEDVSWKGMLRQTRDCPSACPDFRTAVHTNGLIRRRSCAIFWQGVPWSCSTASPGV